VTGPFAVLLHSPDVADRVAAVGDYLLYDTVLTPAAKTFTWLLVASEFECDYEWAFAEPAARKAGIPGAAIDAVRRRDSFAALGEEQALIVDFCHQLLRGNHHVADATYRSVVAHFGVPATVQLAATVGYFVMQACVLNAFEVRPEGDPSELIL
jgi:4-carboxymuconolactone decarboxylase